MLLFDLNSFRFGSLLEGLSRCGISTFRIAMILRQFSRKCFSYTSTALTLPVLIVLTFWPIYSSSFWKVLVFYFPFSQFQMVILFSPFPEITNFPDNSWSVARLLVLWPISGSNIKEISSNFLKCFVKIAHLWWSWSAMKSTFNFYPYFQLPRALLHYMWKPFIKWIELYLFHYKY